ncbi:MAG: cytochrome-c peroxidase [Nitrospira sp.]|nr:cytochrome-c peroxidase [Nitrospira sp.]MDE0486953.1 cytochrome-c peroxidase [Nitrospira sp.]
MTGNKARKGFLHVFKDSRPRWVLIAGVLLLFVTTGMIQADPSPGSGQTPFQLTLPLGLEKDSLVIPGDNPLTKEKVELGKLLFFDTRLSANDTIACASCHVPSLAFTDGQPVSAGIHGQKGGRSAPTAINRVFSSAQFWDGRAATLEEQSVGPFANPIEHGFKDHDELVAKVKSIAGYQPLFERAFGSPAITTDLIGKAIASFQRTLLSGNSAYDRFTMRNEEQALSANAQNGLRVFLGKGQCLRCHFGFNFTDEQYHNLGVGSNKTESDVGRQTVTKKAKDVGAFKTPTLREIANTAPYMHDGSLATLREVVDFYDQGGLPNAYLDPIIKPLKLTDQEKKDLVEFMESLNGEGWNVTPPAQFPK